MAIYFYLSPDGDHATQQAVMAYTHDDVFKPMPGYKVMASHFHLDFNELLRDRNTIDYRPPWVDVFRGLGINIVNLGDFHDDSDPRIPGPKRFMEQKVYFEGTARISDQDLSVHSGRRAERILWRPLVAADAEPGLLLPRANRGPANQQFDGERSATYGKVYHLGSKQTSADARESGEWHLVYDAPAHEEHSRLSRCLSQSGLLSQRPRILAPRGSLCPWICREKRLCEVRCFGVMDDSSNWAPKPKYMLAEGDTYTKWPDDETYPLLAVNYVKLDRVPSYRKAGARLSMLCERAISYGTTGEVLFHNYGVSGTGAKRVYTANVEWTFPLEFAELVWSDGNNGRSQNHSRDGAAAVRNARIQDSVRRDREEVGSVRGVGFGRRWRLHAAGIAEFAVVPRP